MEKWREIECVEMRTRVKTNLPENEFGTAQAFEAITELEDIIENSDFPSNYHLEEIIVTKDLEGDLICKFRLVMTALLCGND